MAYKLSLFFISLFNQWIRHPCMNKSTFVDILGSSTLFQGTQEEVSPPVPLVRKPPYGLQNHHSQQNCLDPSCHCQAIIRWVLTWVGTHAEERIAEVWPSKRKTPVHIKRKKKKKENHKFGPSGGTKRNFPLCPPFLKETLHKADLSGGRDLSHRGKGKRWVSAHYPSRVGLSGETHFSPPAPRVLR